MTTSVRTEGQQTTRQSTARVGRLVVVGDRSGVWVSDDLADYILRQYRPKGLCDTTAVDWARTMTLASRPTSRNDARILIRRMVDIGTWLLGVGYTLAESSDELLSEALLDNYLGSRTFQDSTIQTMRSAFRRVRLATSPERKIVFSGARTDVDSAVHPVTDSEVYAFQRWVEGIDTQHNRHHDGVLLIALVRGGGCTKADLDRIATASIRDAGAEVVPGLVELEVAVPRPHRP